MAEQAELRTVIAATLGQKQEHMESPLWRGRQVPLKAKDGRAPVRKTLWNPTQAIYEKPKLQELDRLIVKEGQKDMLCHD